MAGTRFLSYKGFHLRGLKWHSPSIGVMLLGLAGVVYFFGSYSSCLVYIRFILIESRSNTWTQTLLLAQHQKALLWRITPTCHTNRLDVLSTPPIRNVGLSLQKSSGPHLTTTTGSHPQKPTISPSSPASPMKNSKSSTDGHPGLCSF